MKLIIKEAMPYSDYYKTIDIHQLDSYNLKCSINDILLNKKIPYQSLTLLINNRDIIPFIDYYYNTNGILEFYKNILDVSIYEFKEYGISIGQT